MYVYIYQFETRHYISIENSLFFSSIYGIWIERLEGEKKIKII